MKSGESVENALGDHLCSYLVPALEAVGVNGVRIDARDSAAIKDFAIVKATAIQDSEFGELIAILMGRYCHRFIHRQQSSLWGKDNSGKC